MLHAISALRTSAVFRTAIGVMLLIGFVGTLLWVQPAKPNTPPPRSVTTLQGVWYVVGASEQTGAGPLRADWFALRPTEGNQTRVSWANDGWCSQVDGHIIDGEVHVVDHNARIIVAVHTDATATATVYQGDHRWTQHYVKRSATIPACDWLLQ